MSEDSLGTKEVMELIGLSDRRIRSLTQEGKFPKPDFRTGKENRWSKARIDDWLLKRNASQAIPEPATGVRATSGSQDAMAVEWVSDTPIRTLEDAIAHAEVDLEKWFVDRWECTAWQQGMKLRDFDTRGKVTAEKPVLHNLWRVSVHLKRRLPKPFQDASDALFLRMAKHAPRYQGQIPRRRAPKGKYLLEIDIFDAHFGKLAWAPETGKNYDLKIAEAVYANAVDDLLAITHGFDLAQIVMPVGNDFFHVDSNESTTTAGTRVDSDGRYAKIIEAGEKAVVNAIDRLIQFAPVKVLWIPGNHDRIASYHLVRTLRAWYRHAAAVEVDDSPAVRKYVAWGTNLIGYAHGHQERRASLPTIMATERPADWAATTCHEWRLGHEHRARKMETMSVDTFNGVSVRSLQALTGTDSWHHEKGYVGTTTAAEAFVMGESQGFVGNFCVRARTK